MTEKEAIEALKLEGGLEISGKAVRVTRFFEGLMEAEKALEEIQQYRATGLTPRMVQELKKSHDKAHASAVKNACLLDEYEAIGTIEECSAAVERMKPNKSFVEHNFWKCSYCHTVVRNTDKFCHECGQAIDWRGSKE